MPPSPMEPAGSSRQGASLPCPRAMPTPRALTEFVHRFLPWELQTIKCLDHRNNNHVHEMLESTEGKLVEATQYCHDSRVAHHSFECKNAPAAGHTLKLKDFGFTKLLPRELSWTLCGSTACTVPKVLQGVPHGSPTSDVWTTGTVLYVLLHAYPPFNNTDTPKMLHQEQEGFSVPGHLGISKECQNLLKTLLELDMMLRLPMEGASRHLWLTHP
ncbi:testis-specific serine/threonine-protein kinase 3 [Leptosomus discolor]